MRFKINQLKIYASKARKDSNRPVSQLHGRQAAAKEGGGGGGGEGTKTGREGETESSNGERERARERARVRERGKSEGEEKPAPAPSSSKGAEMAPCSLQKSIGKEEPGTTRGIVADANVLPDRPAHHILVVRVDIVKKV